LYAVGDQGVDNTPAEAVLGSKDLKADFVFEDSSRRHLIIGQCKYINPEKPVAEAEVNDFFHRHVHYADRDWVRKHGSSRASDVLLDYGERLNDGWSATFIFFSTGKASPRILELADNVSREYEAMGAPVSCILYDLGGLKDLYVRSLSLEESIPDEVRIQLPEEKWVLKRDPRETVIAIVKGNILRDLYKRYRESLFAFNIRGYLGDRGLNSEIMKTAEEAPQDFFYFNNGVAAICTSLAVTGNELVATKFQIINGAQTVGSLAKAKPESRVEVLLRVTKTLDVATDKGLNSSIILFNNRQNAVKLSDFRANDNVQKWLERQFNDYRGKYPKVLPDIVYARKRGFKKGGRAAGRGLKLEDVGKIRYAFMFEPTRPLADPRSMWTLSTESGAYEQAFGLGGELVDHWAPSDFEELLFAIATFDFLDEATKREAQENEELASFNRLKYHGLALAGMYFRELKAKTSARGYLASKEKFTQFTDVFWDKARDKLLDAYSEEIDTKKSTVFALVRSEAVWTGVKKKFARSMKIRE
jgi:hypothetical protein